MKDALANVLLGEDSDVQPRVRQATVSGTSPTEVTLGGQSGIPAATCAGYTPNVSDVVLVIQLGTDLIIIDQIVSGG